MKQSNWDETWEEIGTLENTDNGVTEIYAKTIDGDIHYAIVWWHYRSPSVLCELAGGKQIYGGE
jgi:hypothetical protein